MTCDVGGEIVVAPVGSYVVKPRGVYHALCNAGTEPVWVIELHAPGGFEDWYDEYEKIASKFASEEIDEEEHRRARAELSERYGVSASPRPWPASASGPRAAPCVPLMPLSLHQISALLLALILTGVRGR